MKILVAIISYSCSLVFAATVPVTTTKKPVTAAEMPAPTQDATPEPGPVPVTTTKKPVTAAEMPPPTPDSTPE